MGPQRTYYEVLGVETGATPEEIKRRYRRLVKQCHPDVTSSGDAAAHRNFLEITEAYDVLSDPRRRELYDREMAPRRQDRSGPDAGHAGPWEGGESRRPPVRTPPPPLEQVLLDARMSLAHGRLTAAMTGCREALRQDPRCATAYALMGEIYRTTGRIEEARRMYLLALRLSKPRRMGRTRGPRLGRGASLAMDAMQSLPLRPVAVVGWLMVAGLLLLPVVYPGSPVAPESWLVSEWTDNLLLGMVGTGFLTGFLLRAGNLMETPVEELGKVRLPLVGMVPGVLLFLMLGLTFFPAVLAISIFLSTRGDGRLGSVLRMLELTAVGVFLFAFAVPARGQTILFGGNVMFPCMLMGSLAGRMVGDGR